MFSFKSVHHSVQGGLHATITHNSMDRTGHQTWILPAPVHPGHRPWNLPSPAPTLLVTSSGHQPVQTRSFEDLPRAISGGGY